MATMRPRNPDVIVVAFYQRWLADRRAGREHDLAHYQRQFPGYEQDLADEMAALEAGATNVTTPGGLRHGDHFAGYRIERVLGQGGQAIVYLARQLDPPRPIALKILLDSRAWSAAARARFEREVELTARLQHPGICPVFDRGDENGMPWLAMPALRGATLATRMAGLAAGPWQDAVRVLREVADAVAFAHDQGVVHRDLKPGNLWIDPEGHVVVLDFGLAVEVDSAAVDGAPALTRSHDRFGTPGYMAPEQLAGDATTRRTDVFALGVLLFELATSRLPYPTSTLAAYERSAAAGAPDPRSLRRGLPRDLASIVTVACAPDPNDRYRDAGAMRDDLDALLAARSIAAVPPSALRRLRRWARREPALAGSLAALLLVLVAGLSMTWTALERSRCDATRSALTAAASLLQDRHADAARAALAACPDGRGGFVRRLLEAELAPRTECRMQLAPAAETTRAGDSFLVRDGTVVIEFTAPSATLRACATSSEADLAAIAITEHGSPGSVVLVQQRSGSAPLRIEMPDAGVVDLSIAPDTGWLWCLVRPLGVIRRQRLEAWNARAGERLWSREVADGRTAEVLALDDHRAVLGWPDGTVQLIHADERPDEHLFGHRFPIVRMTRAAAGFVTIDNSGAQRLWSTETSATRRHLATGPEPVNALAFAAHLHIDAGLDRRFEWDLERDLLQRSSPTPRSAAIAATGPPAADHPADSLRAHGLRDGSVQLIDTRADTVLATLVSGSAAVTALAFSDDGQRLAVGHDDGLVTVFDARGWPPGSPERAAASARAFDDLCAIGHEIGFDRVATAALEPWHGFARESLQRRRTGWVGDEFVTLIAIPFAPRDLHRFALTQLEQQFARLSELDPNLLPTHVVGLLRLDDADRARSVVDASDAVDPGTAHLLHWLISRLDGVPDQGEIPELLAHSALGAELRLRSQPAHRAALAWLRRATDGGASLRELRRADWADAPAELRSALREVIAEPTWHTAETTAALLRLLVRPLPTEVLRPVADLLLGIHGEARGDRRTAAGFAGAMLRVGSVSEAHAALTSLADQVADWQRLEFEVAAWLALCEHEVGGAGAGRWASRAEAIALASGQSGLLDRRLLIAELRDARR